MSVPAKSKVPRGPNAERRAATRAKIMDAAVRCLAEFGYAATSTPLVAKMAKVSRGSLLHQFPTKVDLILAVATYAARAQGAAIREQLETRPPGRERFLHGVDAIWAALRLPTSVALMEVMIAARSDAELADRYPGFAGEMEKSLHRARRRTAAGLGVEAQQAGEDVDVMSHLTLVALRGLAMETLFVGRPTQDAEKVVELLNGLRRRMVDELNPPHAQPQDL
jgi:AcrR family transcriptional regulator